MLGALGEFCISEDTDSSENLGLYGSSLLYPTQLPSLQSSSPMAFEASNTSTSYSSSRQSPTLSKFSGVSLADLYDEPDNSHPNVMNVNSEMSLPLLKSLSFEDRRPYESFSTPRKKIEDRRMPSYKGSRHSHINVENSNYPRTYANRRHTSPHMQGSPLGSAHPLALSGEKPRISRTERRRHRRRKLQIRQTSSVVFQAQPQAPPPPSPNVYPPQPGEKRSRRKKRGRRGGKKKKRIKSNQAAVPPEVQATGETGTRCE